LPHNLTGVLQDGLDALEIPTTGLLCERLLQYIDLLHHWNQKVNLTAVRDPGEMVVRHLLDSLSVASWVDQSPIIDIGSGAGLPGIPLAMLRPDQTWNLVDSSGKRTSFLREAVRQLELKNVQVSDSRIENLQPDTLASAAIARAFASIGEIADNASHLLRPGGILWAMKGHYPHEELEDLSADFRLVEVIPLEVPGLMEDRHLVKLLFNPEM
jgi:16S rRNA (guanine527-N7)-methyltransferase